MILIKAQYDVLIYWIKEREEIRLSKANNEPASHWTKDPLMSKWRWCNVNRCHDRETRWIFNNIIKPHEDDGALWFNLCLARFINWSPTLARLGYIYEWQPHVFSDVMAHLLASGEKAYTGAYMIRGGTGEDAKVPKYEYLINRVFTPLWFAFDAKPKSGATCAEWSTFLSGIFGMGKFMRNQIITDMKYTKRILPRKTTIDWTTFCLAGPGTTRGLNRLFPAFGLTHQWKDAEANDALRGLRRLVQDDVDEVCAGYFNDLNNLANCLCEFDKYQRLSNGEGEPRSTYRPSSQPLP